MGWGLPPQAKHWQTWKSVLSVVIDKTDPIQAVKSFTCFCLFWFGDHLHQVMWMGLCLFYWTWRRCNSSYLPWFLLLGIAAQKYYLSSEQKALLSKLSSRTWRSLVRPLVLVCSPRIWRYWWISQTDVCMGNNEETGNGVEKINNHVILFSLPTAPHFQATECNFHAVSRHKDNCSSGATLCVKQIWHLQIVFSHYLFAMSWANDLKNCSLWWH